MLEGHQVYISPFEKICKLMKAGQKYAQNLNLKLIKRIFSTTFSGKAPSVQGSELGPTKNLDMILDPSGNFSSKIPTNPEPNFSRISEA